MRIFINSIKRKSYFNYCNRFVCQVPKIFNRYFSTTNRKNQTKFSISKHLQTKIKACGPITVAEFMKEALTNPSGGYYMNRDVFGKEGDFITSPEISPLFGEMIGVWILNEWRKIAKNDFNLVELGPGRGSLTREILKVFKRFKALDKLSFHLVEVSPTLLEIQAKNLGVSFKAINTDAGENQNEFPCSHYKAGITEDGTKVFWYYALEDVPKKFSIFVAHEFFDVLPIHKYQKTNGIWHEVFVDIDPKNKDKFRYVLSNFPTLTAKLFITDEEQRDHVEVSPQTITSIDYLSQFLKQYGGIALIIDYGHNGDKSDTFRAFKNHQQQDPLVDPGSADLTADVDFSLIKKIATKDNRIISFGPVSQGKFLLQLGIDVRLKMLLNNMKDDEKSQLTSDFHMLVDQDKMGECFKVMALFPSILKDHLTMWPVLGFITEKDQAENKNKNKN